MSAEPRSADTNPFLYFWNLGYHSLIPVIPPHATIDERSHMARDGGEGSLGKAPGVVWASGKWGGFKGWQHHVATEADIDEWGRMGASVGLRLGDDGVAAVDIDASDEATATKVENLALAMLGFSPCRVGRAPRRALLFKLPHAIPYRAVVFEGPDGKEKIEILSAGRQIVVQGTHPKTGRRYGWPRKPVALDALTAITVTQLDAFVTAVRAILPRASEVQENEAHDRADIDQARLRGSSALVREAVQALPNNRDIYPSREDYIRVGVALKAALADEGEAFELWCDWAAKDDGGQPSFWEKDWKGIKPPFEIGAGWLYDQAAAAGWSGKERVIVDAFADLDAMEAARIYDEKKAAGGIDAPLFPDFSANAFEAINATPYSFPDPARIQRRQWLYGGHYIRKFVSATVAPSGVGKSSLEIAEALAMASGKPLLGVQPTGRYRVWLWNGEDPRDELERRISAAMLHYGLTPEDLGDRLFVDSGRDTEIVLAVEARDGAKISAPVAAAVVATLQANRIDIMSVDPFVSSHRVSENDNGAIDMVSKKWAAIAGATSTAIELVHHVRKLNGAEITVEDSRGAGSLIATSRSARVLTKMTKAEGARLGLDAAYRRLFRFGDGKNNLAPPAATDETQWMELRSVPLGNGEGSGVDAIISGDSVGVVAAYTVERAGVVVDGDEKGRALRIIAEGEWRRDVRAGDSWVGSAIAQAMQLDIDDAADKARIRQIVNEWVKSGVLREVSRKDAGRKLRTYVECGSADNVSTNAPESVFA